MTAIAYNVKKPPLESMSWSFVNTKPGIIKYDVKHTHVVTIGNISTKMEEEFGTLLESEVFCVKIGDKIINWRVWIFPNGHLKYKAPVSNGHIQEAYNIGHIGVFLSKGTDTEFPLDANMIFSLVDKNGSKVKSRSIDKSFAISDTTGKGVGKFISHSELRENQDLIPDDTLTIMCELTIKGGGVSLVGGESRSSILVPVGNEELSICNFVWNMQKVFDAGQFTDVTIDCQGKMFHCHKAILAGRSPVLEAMFSSNFKEGMGEKVEVVDVTPDIFEELLHFIYSGEVQYLNMNKRERAAKLLVAAEKYYVPDLKHFCEENLCVNLTVDNVLDTLELADLHNAANLRAMALKFIGENAKEVASQKEWRERIPDMMADIIDAIIQK